MADREDGIAIGVIGCGHWGPNHIRNFRTTPGVSVAWAVDPSSERRHYVASQYERVRVTARVEDVLTDPAVNAVVVATPTATHHQIALMAITAGKHVLVEKPLARTSAECDELIAAAAARGVALMVGHVFVFNAGILKLKELLTFNDLGHVYYASAVRANLGPIRDDVNASYDLASHDISIFNFLFDASPVTVSASGRAFLKAGVEDVVFITLTYPREIIVTIEATWLSPKKVREITIVGEKKMATWDDLAPGPVAIYDKGVAREPYYDNYGEFHLLTREGDVTIPKIPLEEPLKREARFFIDSIKKGSATVCSGERGRDVVRTLEAIEASMRREGAPVAVASARQSRERTEPV
jgi:predicted dehydrogenase